MPMSSPKAEMQSEQEFQNPKNLKTYTDFKKTLSENERENFLNFVEEQIQNLEKPINDLEAWLASKNAANQNRWEIYYKNYQKQGVKQKLNNSQQDNGSGDLDRQRAIAEFRKRMKLEQLANETEPSATNSEKSQPEKLAFDELLANPPEQGIKSSLD